MGLKINHADRRYGVMEEGAMSFWKVIDSTRLFQEISVQPSWTDKKIYSIFFATHLKISVFSSEDTELMLCIFSVSAPKLCYNKNHTACSSLTSVIKCFKMINFIPHCTEKKYSLVLSCFTVKKKISKHWCSTFTWEAKLCKKRKIIFREYIEQICYFYYNELIIKKKIWHVVLALLIIFFFFFILLSIIYNVFFIIILLYFLLLLLWKIVYSCFKHKSNKMLLG